MYRKILIGLTGYAAVGKDTVADLLAYQGFCKMAFADALRAEVSTAFGIGMDLLTNRIAKERPQQALAIGNGPTDFRTYLAMAQPSAAFTATGSLSDEWLHAPRSPRQIMQWWGTEYRRKQSPNYWIMTMQARINAQLRNGFPRLVITDCRFDNEVDLLRTMGGEIWQITRPGHTGSTENGHVSTNGGDRFKPEVVIANTHTVRHLHGLVLSEFVARDLSLPRDRVHVEVRA